MARASAAFLSFITDDKHYVEIDWKASDTTTTTNGSLTFWIDGTQQGNITGIDNDSRKVDRAALGAVSGVDTGTRGVEYFDGFESRRTTYIGPVNDVTSITYTYDNVYRLTKANYTSGSVFTYTYDAVGNRLSEQTLTQTTVYTYDIANRLTNVGAQAYTWDNNGNLLNDGQYDYGYDKANRLIGVSVPFAQGGTNFTYNGLGDRQKQGVCPPVGPCTDANSTVTTYTLDLNAGLTQVLVDLSTGAAPANNTYLYGNGRIAQYAGTTPAYFQPDALGSVRQLSNATNAVTLSKRYAPYGSVLSYIGGGTTSYAFTGEWQDATGLVHLRARYYAPTQGRFISKDTWPGRHSKPQSLNRWTYTEGNPVNATDPSGHICFFGQDLPPVGWLPCTPEDKAREAQFEETVAGVLRPVYAAIYDIGANPNVISALPPEAWIAGAKIVNFHGQHYAVVFSNRPLNERLGSCAFVGAEATLVATGLVEGGKATLAIVAKLLGKSSNPTSDYVDGEPVLCTELFVKYNALIGQVIFLQGQIAELTVGLVMEIYPNKRRELQEAIRKLEEQLSEILNEMGEIRADAEFEMCDTSNWPPIPTGGGDLPIPVP